MHKKYRILIVTLIFVAGNFAAINSFGTTSPPPPGGDDPTPPCWPPPCTIPIDGGVSFLIAAGLAYGGKKLYKKNTALD